MEGKRSVRETREIVPRYYGLDFRGEKDTYVFDSPSIAAIAYVALMFPDKERGLGSMLGEWQARKGKELRGEYGYEPLFKLSKVRAKRLLGCEAKDLVGIVRKAMLKNHGSYNLWDKYGEDAVSEGVLYGERLSASVRSREGGWYHVILKNAVRNKDWGMRYTDSTCQCEDHNWTEIKGSHETRMRLNCVHVKTAETANYLQSRGRSVWDTKEKLIREKDSHEGERSLTFNFVDNKFLRFLVSDVLIAREVLRESAYSVDRKLLSGAIAPWIMPPELQQEVTMGNATFEILKGQNRRRGIDTELLRAEEIIDEAFSKALWEAGYRWGRYCVELGRAAMRYENSETGNSVSLCFGGKESVNDKEVREILPFYVFRSFSDARVCENIFTPDSGPQDPFAQTLAVQRRIDDRTRRISDCRIEPAVRINVPEVGESVSLRYELPKSVIEAYRKEISERSRNPVAKMKALRIYY